MLSSTRATMIVFQTVNIFILAVTVFLVLSQSPKDMDICMEVAFYRRSEMDDLVFTESLIEEMNQVDTRADCFAQCHRRELCNLVLYNLLTRKCRLYTEVFTSVSDGKVEAGWQYYGISCANFRFDNAHADVDAINTVPKDVCHSITVDYTSACYAGASWEVVPVKCVSCYTGPPRQSENPSHSHLEDLTFDLAVGMKQKMDVSGTTTLPSRVFIVHPAIDVVYTLFVAWDTTPTKAFFNTQLANVLGAEESVYGVSVNNISSFSIEIHISLSTFETYVDGAFWMTNQMRLPLTDVRDIYVAGFTTLHSFHIGLGRCSVQVTTFTLSLHRDVGSLLHV